MSNIQPSHFTVKASSQSKRAPTAAEEDGPQVMGIHNVENFNETEKARRNVNRVTSSLGNNPSQSSKTTSVDDSGLEVLDEASFLSMKEELRISQMERQALLSVQEEVISTTYDKVPWFPLTGIPSEAKTYPKGYEFSYRLYNYEEILLLNNKDLKEYDRFRYMLRGIRSTGSIEVNPMLMTWDDFRYVSTLRKLEAFGASEFKIPYRCPFCLSEEHFRFTLDMVGFSTMKATKGWARLVLQQYPDEEFHISPLTVGDMLWLYRNNVFYKTDEEGIPLVDGAGRQIPDTLASLAKQCSSHKFLDAYEKFTSLYIASDIQTLESIEDYFDHGVAPIEFTCTARQDLPLPDNYEELDEEEKEQARRKANFLAETCDQKLRIYVDGGNTIFIPFRGSDEDASYGVFFD